MTLRWMLQDLTGDQSILIQQKAWSVSQLVITWAMVDPVLCGFMVSPGLTELTHQNRLSSTKHKAYA